jgi:hypothetical protein
MATIREARYLFRVADGRSELEKGAQDGTLVTLRRVSHPFIVAEHASECEGFKPPLDNGGFIFAIRDHTSMEEAKDIANFLNRNLQTIGTVTLDAEDVAAEVEQSKLNLVQVKEGLTDAVAVLEARLTAGDLQGATQSVEAVKGWAGRLSNEWAGTLEKFR